MDTLEKNAREQFGEALSSARKQYGWSQTQLATKANRGLPVGEKLFDQKKISNLELNKSNVRLTEAGIQALQSACQLPNDVVSPMLEKILLVNE